MKHTPSLFLVALFLVACIDQEATSKSRLEMNVETVNFCQKEVGKTFVWNHLQLRNTGSEAAMVAGIAVRGDKNCAFKCFYERPPADETASSTGISRRSIPAGRPSSKVTRANPSCLSRQDTATGAPCAS